MTLSLAILCPMHGAEWIGRISWLPRAPLLGTDFYDRSILRPKHRAYYCSGGPVIKIGPKGALGSHEIPIYSAPSLGQSIVGSERYTLQVPTRFLCLNRRRLAVTKNHSSKGVFLVAWLSDRLRRWSNKSDIVGSIPVTTDFFLISCDSNQVPKWFGTHYNLEVPL